jgi:FkbM family methyltransferase
MEPQPACGTALATLAKQPDYSFHAIAPVGPEQKGSYARLAITSGRMTTGAYITFEPTEASSEVPTSTLAELFAATLRDHERILLKLDLQGYELHALPGGQKILATTDLLLIEVSFFAQAYESEILSLMRFLDRHNFAVHDIAAIGARPRDDRARTGDFVFVRKGSQLALDSAWS